MTKRVAALDLGTNTFHLIIADVSANQIEATIYATQRNVKLGEGGIADGIITEAAFKRGLEALSDFNKILAQYQVDVVKTVGTAALRAAKNGPTFIQEVKEATGIHIEIIDGDTEATLIYNGVRQAIDITQPALIMDIGGGSVEFILADANGIKWKRSYPLGAAKLMAEFQDTDPISTENSQTIYRHLDSTLVDLKEIVQQFKPQLLIGSAGAFETFANLSQIKSSSQVAETGKTYTFENKVLQSILEEIISSTHHARVNNTAITPVRTDMIVVASILTKYIIESLEIPSVMMTTYALKEGLLISG